METDDFDETESAEATRSFDEARKDFERVEMLDRRVTALEAQVDSFTPARNALPIMGLSGLSSRSGLLTAKQIILGKRADQLTTIATRIAKPVDDHVAG